MGALDAAATAEGVIGSTVNIARYFHLAQGIVDQLNRVVPSDFRYAWQRDPQVAAMAKALHLRVVRGPDIGRNPVNTIPGEPGIPRFATPGFAPAGGMPVTGSPATTPPPPVIGGPSANAGTGGPISDTAMNKGTNMDLGNLLGQAIQTWGSVETARAGTPATGGTLPVNYNLSGAGQGVIPTVGGGGVSTAHPSTPGVQYVGLFNDLGQLVGFKAKKAASGVIANWCTNRTLPGSPNSKVCSALVS